MRRQMRRQMRRKARHRLLDDDARDAGPNSQVKAICRVGVSGRLVDAIAFWEA